MILSRGSFEIANCRPALTQQIINDISQSTEIAFAYIHPSCIVTHTLQARNLQ